MNTKICSRCKQEKPLAEFYKHKRDGYRSRCKPCHKLDVKEYFSRPEAKQLRKVRMKQYRNQPEVKMKNCARAYMHYRLRLGQLIPEPCAMCGKEQSGAHHPDYEQPLMVVWLCHDCHVNLANKLGVEK